MSIQTTKGQVANASGSREHFSRLKALLRDGAIGPGPKGRRYIPGANDGPGLSWDQMADLGNQGSRTPGLRRTRRNG